jgi:hypothetical protein
VLARILLRAMKAATRPDSTLLPNPSSAVAEAGEARSDTNLYTERDSQITVESEWQVAKTKPI